VDLLADTAARAFGAGLIVSAFGFGFRHGIDWDHIAAITDIASSQTSPRAGLRFASLYAAGHAVVVFAIGTVAIVARRALPAGIDAAMGRVVGVTLLVLGVYVLYALIRYRKDFRLRSRWMLVFSAIRSASTKLRARRERRAVVHAHTHVAEGPFPHHTEEGVPAPVGEGLTAPTHTHRHTHADPFADYGTKTSLLVGALHGVGAETPTQVLIFLAAAGAGGAWAGLTVLAVFLVGLFAANTLVALAATSGFLAASRHFVIYAVVSVVTAVTSLVLGTVFLLGHDSWLPALFGG
jgi:hypothetical protein